ncbi:hypothetical protein AYO21_05879 [Fonsecaea monophora]|uniref:DUF6590 domain-containing protein n=1 Tax=Fonsecaea monophora TaxID=254056 RepID=A0A177F6H9_9EURO|nr:hypothetical protein AYO21_05879 [Fonsecaea monophora]OAG39814.1 hypothetical protein AYO21_05879 [Fonsecaea monophora]
MSDKELESPADVQNVSVLTQKCDGLLEECLHNRLLMEHEWAENKLAAFRLWVSETGAGMTDMYESSLGDRLSQKPTLLSVFADLLRLLGVFIRECQATSLTTHGAELEQYLSWAAQKSQTQGPIRIQRGRSSGTQRASSRRTSRSISPWSDQSSFASDSDGKERLSDGRLAEAMQSVESILDQLKNVSLAVRRTGHQLRLQKADSVFNASEHSALESFLIFWVLVRTSKGPSTSPRTMGDNEELTPVQRRLINANLRRRNRFLYAQKHSRTAANPSAVEMTVDAKPNDIASAEKDLSATTVPKASNDSSMATKFEASTGFFDENLPAPFSQISSTTSRVRYPYPPKISSNVKYFKCPCCCQTLNRAFLFGNRWRRHLAEDVCPYTCIYDQCPTPEATFATHQAWMSHMTGAEHPDGKSWTCLMCADGVLYGDCSILSGHIKQKHSDSIATHQIPTVLETSMSPATTTLSCPLCRPTVEAGTRTARTSWRHIAEHIHDFALLALPWAPDNPICHPDAIDKGRTKVASWLGLQEPSMSHTESPHDDHDSTTNEAGIYYTEEAYFAENRDFRSDTSSISTDTFRDLQGLENTSILPFPENLPEVGKNLESTSPGPVSTSTISPSTFMNAKLTIWQPRSSSFPSKRASDETISRIDARYIARPPAYYQPGRVFAMLRDEQDIEPQRMDIIAPGTVNLSGNKRSLGSQTSSSVHTMVVVQAHSGYCECIQVNTYDQRGLLNFIHSPKDVNAHAVIYVEGTAPHLLFKEPRSNKRPIAVKKTNPEQNLAGSSRLHYARVYNVQYTAKTIDIGYVDESLPDLLRDFQTVNGLSEHTLPKEGRKPSDELPRRRGKAV